MSAPLNPEPSQDFPLRGRLPLNAKLLFLKLSFPDGIQVHSLKELSQYGTICGIKGFYYHNIGLPENDSIDEIRDK